MPDQPQRQNSERHLLPEVRIAPFQLTIYTVSDSELELLERGSPDSLYLNFGIFLLSAAMSFTVALVTTTITSDRVFATFVALTAIGYIGGLLLILLWRRSHQSVSKTIETIRKRLPPEGEPELPTEA